MGFGMELYDCPAGRPTDLHAGRMHRKRLAQQRPHTERKERPRHGRTAAAGRLHQVFPHRQRYRHGLHGGQGPAADGRCPRHEHEAAEERVDGRRQCLAAPFAPRPLPCAGGVARPHAGVQPAAGPAESIADRTEDECGAQPPDSGHRRRLHARTTCPTAASLSGWALPPSASP